MGKILAVLVLALVGTVGAQITDADLFQAIRSNELARLGKAIKPATVNTRDSHGSTLLMYAAAYGSTGAVKLLLDKGADVNAKNQFDANGAGLGRERSGESESAHRKRRRC